MIFQKKSNKKVLSNALAMGLIATSVMPVINTQERVAAEQNAVESQSQNQFVEITSSRVNVRKGPSTGYGKVTTLSRGNKVKFVSTCSNGWYEIEYNGNVAYITNQYTRLTTDSSQTNNSAVTSTDLVNKVGKVTVSTLNVRNGVGTRYSIKTKIRRNNVVGVLNTYSNGWLKIKLSNSSIGYVDGRYLSISEGNSDNINVSQPSNNEQNNNTATDNTTTDNTTTDNTTTDNTVTNNSSLDTVLSTLKAQVGKPYVYGAAGPGSFDCSGLTYYAYKQAGIYLNRSSRAQASNGVYVNKSDLRPGDLVFFNSGSNTIRHCGMYVGDGQFIHSPSPGKSVKYENINSSYYTRGYVTARRIIQ